MREESTTNLPSRDIYSVSRLVSESRAVIEGSFPLLWIEGEISNLARPASGHIYFSLKDSAAQVRCAMFRMRGRHLHFSPQNGIHVMVRARISLYEARGEFQIIVEQMEEAGFGELQRAFEALKKRLGEAGLFDTTGKKALPTLPQRIGVITSPTGAAIRDILSVTKRRFPAIPLLIYPVPVQGEEAAMKIVEAIKLADKRQECDLLILARGGGSLEDLWSFNEESVAHAIFNCAIPIISAIGHEIDFTIADFVADQRAATPSAAAELATPDQEEWRLQLARHQVRLTALLTAQLKQQQQQLQWLERRITQQHPGHRLRSQAQRLDELEQRLHTAWRHHYQQHRSHLNELSAKLHQQTPQHQLQQLQSRHATLRQRLMQSQQHLLERKQQQLTLLGRALDGVSPLATLNRGYAIVKQVSTQRIVRRAMGIKKGEQIETRLAQGRLLCTVDKSFKA